MALFFSISFAIIILVSAGVRFLYLWVDWARSLPPKNESFLTLLITSAHWALSLAVYSSLLLSLCYAVRKRYFAPMAVICLIALSFGFTFSLLMALENWKFVPPAKTDAKPLGENGLILSNSINKNEMSIVLLNGAADPLGPRIVVIPGQPINFQEAAGANFDLPPVPFGDDTPWFLNSFAIDIRLNAEHLSRLYNEGLIPFLIYAGALIFLLCSLGFAIKFSVWPLANFFLAALAFRGVLALETFFNSPEMQEIFSSFLNNRLPVSFAVPFIFAGFGLLVHIYLILVFAARRRSYDDV